MTTVTELQIYVRNLAVRISQEIAAVRSEIVVASGGAPSWANVTDKPLTFTPAAHTHVAADITDFAAAADARIAAAGVGGAPAWASITGKPATFAPSAHTHVAAEITDFAAAADARIALAGAGAGNVAGDSASVDGELALFNGVTGKAIKRSNTVPSANGLSLISAANYAAMRTSLGLVIGTDVQAYNAKLAALVGLTWAADKQPYFTGAGAVATTDITPYARTLLAAGDDSAARGIIATREALIFALSDETTAITAGVAKVTVRMPYAFVLTEPPRSSLATAATSGGLVTVDINEGGASILSTKLSIDQGEKTSTTAATPAVLSDSNLADDAEITFDIDAAAAGAKGLKVTLIGHRV